MWTTAAGRPALLHPCLGVSTVKQDQLQAHDRPHAQHRPDGPHAASRPDRSGNNGGTAFDPDARYALPFGTRVIQREKNCVQIGTDPPRTVLIRNAPAEAAAVLGGLDGGRTVAELLRTHRQAPQDARWCGLLEQLLAAGVLLPVEHPERAGTPLTVGAHLTDERAALTHRHGHAAAARILQARDDALVVVRGEGDIAFSITAHLAAAGIGHLHHDPVTRTLPWSADASQPDRPHPDEAAAAARRSADLRSRFPALRLHTPAAHQHPTAVVLTRSPPDLGLAAGYSRAQVPHLSVAAGAARVVVGPFVLPGRSTCLSCVHRHRTDADPGWPAVAGQLGALAHGAPAALVAAAVCLAVGEVLEHVDGMKPPQTVCGTLEWRLGDIGPRRRSWFQHPDCGCHRSPSL